MGFWNKLFKGLVGAYKTADRLEKAGVPVSKIPVAGKVKTVADIAVAVKKQKDQ